MGKKLIPVLQKRWGLWHIDKIVVGRRLCESTGMGSLEEAERYLARRLEENRLASVYGVRPARSFRQAATKYLEENQQKSSIKDDAGRLKKLDPFIGDLALDKIHMGSLQPYIVARRAEKIKTRTINHGLKIVRHLLNLAAGEWIDEYGLTWLHAAPKIKLLPEYDNREPYPLEWDEQERLFAALPEHLRLMALFTVNTGLRDKEVCSLQWKWEQKLPELDNASVFIIPAFIKQAEGHRQIIKNGYDRLVIVNRIAQQVLEKVRGQHPDYVFTYRGKRLRNMLSSGWRVAREQAGIPQVREHDLKHTFGCRLRAADVSFEDRQDLLGHKSNRAMTTHYSAANVRNLLTAANKVCIAEGEKPAFTLLRKVA